jgi:K(+)-stimulated pyrophosphate-energized sodium pump
VAQLRRVLTQITPQRFAHHRIVATIITGLAVCLQDAVLPVTGITAGMWIAYSVAGGLYGVTLAAAAMLSTVMHEVRTISDALDAVGNTTKAMAEGY